MADFDSLRNYHTYIRHRRSLDDYHPSEKALLVPILQQVRGAILDVGSASGGFFEAISAFPFSKYVGVDINGISIEHARRVVKDSRASFIHGDFLAEPVGATYELVNMFEILFLFENYKRFVARLFECSSRFIHFTNRVRLEGETVTDVARSHAFNHYLGTNPILNIVFNLGEFVAYLRDSFVFERLSVYGYEVPESVWRRNYSLPTYEGIFPVAMLIDVAGTARRVSIELVS